MGGLYPWQWHPSFWHIGIGAKAIFKVLSCNLHASTACISRHKCSISQAMKMHSSTWSCNAPSNNCSLWVWAGLSLFTARSPWKSSSVMMSSCSNLRAGSSVFTARSQWKSSSVMMSSCSNLRHSAPHAPPAMWSKDVRRAVCDRILLPAPALFCACWPWQMTDGLHPGSQESGNNFNLHVSKSSTTKNLGPRPYTTCQRPILHTSMATHFEHASEGLGVAAWGLQFKF